MTQRHPKVVRYGIGEGLQFLVGRFQLRGTPCDLLFESPAAALDAFDAESIAAVERCQQHSDEGAAEPPGSPPRGKDDNAQGYALLVPNTIVVGGLDPENIATRS